MACSPGTLSDQGSRHANGAFHSMRTRARVPIEWGCALADSPSTLIACAKGQPQRTATRRITMWRYWCIAATAREVVLRSWTAIAASAPSLMAGGALPKHRCRRPQQRQCPWSRLKGCSGRSRTFKNHTVILLIVCQCFSIHLYLNY